MKIFTGREERKAQAGPLLVCSLMDGGPLAREKATATYVNALEPTSSDAS